MALDEPPEDDSLCGDELSSQPGKYCDNTAKEEDGKCRFHSDHVEHHGKGGRWTHGAYAERSKYYQKLPEEEQEWVDAIFHSFLEEAPFDEDKRGKCELLWNVCIDISKQRSINQYIAEKEIAVEKFAGAGESGVHYEDEENPLHLTYDRLSRSNMKVLKELGILGNSPDGKKADAQQTFVDILSASFED